MRRNCSGVDICCIPLLPFLLQLGSNALGRANDEDAEKGLVYLDVFKHSRLDALKPREVDEEEMKPKNGVLEWESGDLDIDIGSRTAGMPSRPDKMERRR